MKNTHTCPKCGGKRLLYILGKAEAYGSGNNIPLGMTIFSYVKVNRYVCTACGYSEEWIDLNDAEKLKQKYNEL